MKARKTSASLTRTFAEWVALGVRPDQAQRCTELPFLGLPELSRRGAFHPAELALISDIADGKATHPVLISPDTARKLLGDIPKRAEPA